MEINYSLIQKENYTCFLKEVNGIEPLKFQGKTLMNRNNKVVMNDRWLWVSKDRIPININRHSYCHKVALSKTFIVDEVASFGDLKLDEKLKKFIEVVSPFKLFTFQGVSYVVLISFDRKKGIAKFNSFHRFWERAETGGIGWIDRDSSPFGKESQANTYPKPYRANPYGLKTQEERYKKFPPVPTLEFFLENYAKN